jgi:hypothetical protein
VYTSVTIAESASLAESEQAFIDARFELAHNVAKRIGMDWCAICMRSQKPLPEPPVIDANGVPWCVPIGRALKRAEVEPLIAALNKWKPDAVHLFHGDKSNCGWMCNMNIPIPPAVRASMRRQWAADTFPPGTPRRWDRMDIVQRAAERKRLEWAHWIQDGLEATP